MSADRKADFHTLSIEWFDSGTVGVSGKLVHGCVEVREKEGEGGDPEVAELLHGSEGEARLRSECVIVVGRVPHKPEQVNDGCGRVAPSLL